MIIAGEPTKGLQKHQQDAYKAVKEGFEKDNKAAVVIPTGCGKSFISLQLMADNKDKQMLFIAPTHAIKSQMYNYIAKYIAGEIPTKQRPARMIAEEYFPNLKIILYPSLLRMGDDLLQKLNPEIIMMDELHRTGGEKWGGKINKLLELNPNAKVLGLTATPDRMDDKNVVDELFDGHIAYELTLVEAIKRRIVKAPNYVKCDYALGDMLTDVETAIKNCTNEEEKKELQTRYEKMRRIVDEAAGIQELFEENMTNRTGKYIVFCKNKEHMEQIMTDAKEWFANIDKEPEMYSVFSGYGKDKNQDIIKQFEDSKTEHLKLLFSIDMLNEGLHVSDISGVIMLRPTSSRIMYLQQLGRALSSDTTREKTIVFDLVNNYIQYNLDREINGKTNEPREKRKINDGNRIGGEDYWDEEHEDDIDIFRIEGYTKEFLDLLQETEEIVNRSSFLINARAIKNWMEKNDTVNPPSVTSKNEEEADFGRKLAKIRNLLITPYEKLQTEEERTEYRKKHPYLEEILEIIRTIDENKIPTSLANARQIKKWMQENSTTTPPNNRGEGIEKKLGEAYLRLKQQVRNPYLAKSEEEQKEYLQKHPYISEILQILEEIEINNVPKVLKNARDIKNWMQENNTTCPPNQKAEGEEGRLGNALCTIKRNITEPYKKLQTEEERNGFKKKYPYIDELMEIITDIEINNIPEYLKNLRQVRQWMDDRNTTKPPSITSSDEEERKLGKSLSTAKSQVIKPYFNLKTEEEKKVYREKYPYLDEIFEIVSSVDINGKTKKQRELAELIKADLQVRRELEQAKELEAGYEQLLTQKLGESSKHQDIRIGDTHDKQ